MADMSGPSSLPSTPLPSSMGSSHPFFESTGISNQDEDNIWGSSSQPSPGSKRCPTFKDYSEKIKQLQQENFQLKVRVYLSEQKTGVKNSSSDFAVLFQQNIQQLQNALNANNAATSSNASHSTTTSSSSNDMLLSAQLSSFKSENEQLHHRVIELEQKISSCESALKDKQTENDHLAEQNETLIDRLRSLETEFSQAKAKMHNQAQLINASTINDVDVERGAELAFGDDFGSNDQYRQEMEEKLENEMRNVRHLQEMMKRLNKKLSKSKDVISNLEKNESMLEKDKKKLQEKLIECSKVFVDLGKRNVTLSKEVETLKLQVKEDEIQIMNQSNGLAMDSLMFSDRYDNVRELVTMLQGRMKEIVAFVDALFKLESKNVFTIVGLQDENRDKLQVSLEHCRHLSHNLDELFQFTDNSIMTDRRLRMAGLNISKNENVSYNSHLYDRRDAGDLDSPGRPPRKYSVAFKEIQCNLLSDGFSSTHSERSVTKFQRDLTKSETKRKELLADQMVLRSQLDSLQSNLHAAYNKIQDLEKVNRTLSCQPASALEMENKALANRLSVSESALRKMHQEHANLVAQLKKLQSVQMSTSQDKLISNYMESERPSDTTSPDLGIDSGHDAANSDDSHSVNFKLENRELKKTNKELAIKLRHTKQMLNNTLEKLHSTSKQKEEVEKAICRQLHKTHTILRQAKKSVEHFTANQENLVPSS